LKQVTPEKVWTLKKSCVSHLRVFGSICHRHVPEERRKKLDDRSEKLVLIGYHPTEAYKLHDPYTNKVIIN
jgi:hypothetical protein